MFPQHPDYEIFNNARRMIWEEMDGKFHLRRKVVIGATPEESEPVRELIEATIFCCYNTQHPNGIAARSLLFNVLRRFSRRFSLDVGHRRHTKKAIEEIMHTNPLMLTDQISPLFSTKTGRKTEEMKWVTIMEWLHESLKIREPFGDFITQMHREVLNVVDELVDGTRIRNGMRRLMAAGKGFGDVEVITLEEETSGDQELSQSTNDQQPASQPNQSGSSSQPSRRSDQTSNDMEVITLSDDDDDDEEDQHQHTALVPMSLSDSLRQQIQQRSFEHRAPVPSGQPRTQASQPLRASDVNHQQRNQPESSHHPIHGIRPESSGQQMVELIPLSDDEEELHSTHSRSTPQFATGQSNPSSQQMRHAVPSSRRDILKRRLDNDDEDYSYLIRPKKAEGSAGPDTKLSLLVDRLSHEWLTRQVNVVLELSWEDLEVLQKRMKTNATVPSKVAEYSPKALCFRWGREMDGAGTTTLDFLAIRFKREGSEEVRVILNIQNCLHFQDVLKHHVAVYKSRPNPSNRQGTSLENASQYVEVPAAVLSGKSAPKVVRRTEPEQHPEPDRRMRPAPSPVQPLAPAPVRVITRPVDRPTSVQNIRQIQAPDQARMVGIQVHQGPVQPPAPVRAVTPPVVPAPSQKGNPGRPILAGTQSPVPRDAGTLVSSSRSPAASVPNSTTTSGGIQANRASVQPPVPVRPVTAQAPVAPAPIGHVAPPADPAAPARRGRGRPRKNPLPASASSSAPVAAQSSSSAAPTTVQLTSQQKAGIRELVANDRNLLVPGKRTAARIAEQLILGAEEAMNKKIQLVLKELAKERKEFHKQTSAALAAPR